MFDKTCIFPGPWIGKKKELRGEIRSLDQPVDYDLQYSPGTSRKHTKKLHTGSDQCVQDCKEEETAIIFTVLSGTKC